MHRRSFLAGLFGLPFAPKLVETAVPAVAADTSMARSSTYVAVDNAVYWYDGNKMHVWPRAERAQLSFGYVPNID